MVTKPLGSYTVESGPSVAGCSWCFAPYSALCEDAQEIWRRGQTWLVTLMQVQHSPDKSRIRDDYAPIAMHFSSPASTNSTDHVFLTVVRWTATDSDERVETSVHSAAQRWE